MPQVFPIDYHIIFLKLHTTTRCPKHSCMVHSTLIWIKMLSLQSLASSSFAWYVIPISISVSMLLVFFKVLNRSYNLRNRLDLLSKISTPKLREWETNCMRKNPYLQLSTKPCNWSPNWVYNSTVRSRYGRKIRASSWSVNYRRTKT